MTATLEHPATRTVIARDYWRNSSGRSVSIDRQEASNGRMISANGWLRHAQPYSDLVSASKYGRHERGGYASLIADLTAGRFGADILLVHEASRGSRHLTEWSGLIDLCEHAGVKIGVATHGRVYDPSNSRDVRTLQEDGVDAQYESGKLSDRITDGKLVAAERGMPNNSRIFGYLPVYAERDGSLENLKPHPDEAPIVRELFARVISGDPLRSIVLDFDERGIVSRNGKPLSQPVLRSMLTRRAYIAEREHKGEIHPAKWPALVSRSDFLAVGQILEANAEATRDGRQRRHGRATHLLSGIARCDVCGEGLGVLSNAGRAPVYRCKVKSCVRVDYADLSSYVESVILDYLERPGNIEQLGAEDRSDDTQAAKDDVAAIREKIQQNEHAYADDLISAEMAGAKAKKLERQLADAQQRLDDLSTPSRLAGLLPPGEALKARWNAASDVQRRQIAAVVCTPAVLGELRVARSPMPRQRVDVRQRVVWLR